MVMVMSSVELVHPPLDMVHLRVVTPRGNPLTAEVARAALAKVAVPETMVQAPVPVVGTLAASVAVVTLHKP